MRQTLGRLRQFTTLPAMLASTAGNHVGRSASPLAQIVVEERLGLYGP